jgi:hypothetical protein
MAIKKKKVSKSNLVSFLVVTVVIIVVVIFSSSIWVPAIKNTFFLNQVYKAYQDNTWVTFTSERAKFSFQHPLNWPVTAASDEQLKENNRDFVGGRYVINNNEIENIDFQEEWVRNAGGSRLGYIVVEKTKYKNLKDYVVELSKERVVEMYVKGIIQKVTIKPPKIEYLEIGGVDAISVTDSNSFGRFNNEEADYRFIKNGWLYKFVTTGSSRFMENKQKNSEIFKKIVSSIMFTK